MSQKSTTSPKPSTPKKKPAALSVHSEHDVNQNFVILWVDSNIDENQNIYHDSINKLRRITSLFYTCTDLDQCITYVNNLDKKKISIIVSDTLGEQLVASIHD